VPLWGTAMPITTAANHKFLQTDAPAAAADWDALLKHQVDFALPQELEFLFRLAAWRQATSVLDAGCGNGYFLSRLHGFFPDKEYCGVDVSAELIARAGTRYPHIAFTRDDIVSFTPARRFAVILMRFLVQHVNDLGPILKAADRLLYGGGKLVVIETDLDGSRNHPALPRFHDMLLAYARVSAAHGSVKTDFLADSRALVAAAARGWSVEVNESVACPRTGPFSSSQLLAIYQLWVDLCDRSAMFDFEFGAVREELDAWARRDVTFSSIGLRFVVLSRSSKPGLARKLAI
jgi:SAM-dependent methyltransferase